MELARDLTRCQCRPPPSHCWTRRQTLGTGGCAGTSGFVQLAWDEEDSTQVAIKFVARGSAYLSRAAEREILNHRLLTGHAHIVQFKEARPCACRIA